jgi:hypothetical protein
MCFFILSLFSSKVFALEVQHSSSQISTKILKNYESYISTNYKFRLKEFNKFKTKKSTFSKYGADAFNTIKVRGQTFSTIITHNKKRVEIRYTGLIPNIVFINKNKIFISEIDSIQGLKLKVKEALGIKMVSTNILIDSAYASLSTSEEEELTEIVTMNAIGVVYVGSSGFSGLIGDMFGDTARISLNLFKALDADLTELNNTCSKLEPRVGQFRSGINFVRLLSDDISDILEQTKDQNERKISNHSFVQSLLRKYARSDEHDQEIEQFNCYNFVAKIFGKARTGFKLHQSLFCDKLDRTSACYESLRTKQVNAKDRYDRTRLPKRMIRDYDEKPIREKLNQGSFRQ